MPLNNNVNIVLSLLVNFVKNETGKHNIAISKNTQLKDLGLDGLKGIMFIKKYSAEFKVNIDDFNFEKHFTEKQHQNQETTKPLTIGYLERAIIHGRFEDDIK
jgi:acyl carrier protein